MYVFVRKDLSLEQIVVQSCHAAIESSRNYLNVTVDHPHLVLLGVENETKLMQIHQKLELAGIKNKPFFEPDQNNEMTAIATAIVSADTKRFFKKYQCLKLGENK